MTTRETGTSDHSSAAGGNAAAAFEAWQETFRKSAEAWAQAAPGFPGFTSPGPGATPFGGWPFAAPPFGMGGGPTPGMSAPFQGFNAEGLMQMWQQLYQVWAEQARQMMANPSFPQSLSEAEKQWAQGLESLASTFAKSMSTEEFSQALGKYMEQVLVWQGKLARESNPQIDAALRAWNMPSRAQIDRMFERIIGLEGQIESLSDAVRKLQATVDAATTARRPTSAPVSTAGPGARPEAQEQPSG